MVLNSGHERGNYSIMLKYDEKSHKTCRKKQIRLSKELRVKKKKKKGGGDSLPILSPEEKFPVIHV